MEKHHIRSHSADEDRLDETLNEIATRLQRGDAVDIDEYIDQFPEHADRLRRFVPGILALVDLGHTDATQGSDEVASIGQLGDFRILREVGRGGMGVVYEAEQVSLDRRVALKVLPFASVLSPRQLQRFKNEARAAASLDHPNIVHVYSVGNERGVHYYAMQFVDGDTVAQVIEGLRSSADPANVDDSPAPGAQAAHDLASGGAGQRARQSAEEVPATALHPDAPATISTQV